MDATYLRVKKWKDWQHYKDREPPWVKLHSKLLGDSAFMELDELEQWQLVRIWMIASRSSRFTYDNHRRLVPVVANDEMTIRRAISTLKKVPLAKFIREGFLIIVSEDELEDISQNPAENASAMLAPGKHQPPSSCYHPLEVEGREVEHFSSELKGSARPAAAPQPLPVEKQHMLERLLTVCASSLDDTTSTVFKSYATRLPQSSLAKVIESTERKPAPDRSRYANGALKSELRERGRKVA